MLRFDPFSDIDSVAKQLLGASAGSPRVPRFMPIDLYKSGDHYVLKADLPGVDPGSVDVDVDNGILTLRAERTAPSDQGVQWITSERFSGKYMRQLSLGDGIDTEGIAATYDNGVLTVTIPVAEKAKPRRIEIGRSSDGPQQVETGGRTEVTSGQ